MRCTASRFDSGSCQNRSATGFAPAGRLRADLLL